MAKKRTVRLNSLLKEVISLTAFTRLDKFWKGATYKFDKILISGDQADVVARFTANETDFFLEYYLQKKGGAWRIHDIAYDNERYSFNIREKIDSFLRENTFAKLLDSLRRRRDELKRS